jgi:hypothetical protein
LKTNRAAGKTKSKTLLWASVSILISSLNFASINFLTVAYNVDLMVYFLAIIAVSCISSVLSAEMEKSFLYGFMALVFGFVIAVGVLSGPPLVYQRTVAEANAAAVLSLGILSKFLLVSIVACIIGIIIGWFFLEISNSWESN